MHEEASCKKFGSCHPDTRESSLGKAAVNTRAPFLLSCGVARGWLNCDDASCLKGPEGVQGRGGNTADLSKVVCLPVFGSAKALSPTSKL